MEHRGSSSRRGRAAFGAAAAVAVVALGILIISPLAAALAPARQKIDSVKAKSTVGKVVRATRPQPSAVGGASGIAAPASGQPPSVVAGSRAAQVIGSGKAPVSHKPAPPLSPSHGTVLTRSAPTFDAQGKSEVGGVVRRGPAHPGAGRLIIPPPSTAHAQKAKGFTPSTFYTSTQLDNFSAQCGFGVNETTIAQSTANPNLLVAGANTYYDNNGNCQDSHVGVYSSSDGGQHWHFQVMPGLIDPFSGDPVVTFDPVRQVFVFAFIEADRNNDAVGRIGVEVSSDGVNWSRNTTLDSNTTSFGTDKPSIAVDQNPSSPHFGRVAVAWTRFFGNNAVYEDAVTDNGGVTWTFGTTSINFTNHECGNGTSAAFNANGELMVAWADCSGGVNSIFEEVSSDGGVNWTAPSDKQITTTSPLAGAEDPNPADCLLNNGGTAFRCNSFPTLAGDPNSGDAGGTAFVVVWADVRSTTQSGQTANVSQLIGLSTTDDGNTWNGGPSFGFDFMAFNDFGDKFFPAASFAPNGRLTVSYSSREDDASSGNPNGRRFNEHQTEAASLTNLRNNSFVSYTTDGTLGDPGALAFIGDYSGNSSLDQNFDTFPVWTDLRNGFPSARTQDLCYADCFTALSPDSPLFISRAGGSTFQDFYSFSIDPTTGSGQDFWNVVGTREGSDGTSVDNDTFLAPNRYYNTSLASSAFSPAFNDYLLVNGNFGHAPNTVYFPQVHSFSTLGGFYSIEWDAGHIVLGTSLSGSMSFSNVARVYDSALSSGTQYFFGLRPSAGNSSNYSLVLHSASRGAEQGRPNAVADSGDVAPGSPAFVAFNTGADPTQFDGLVVVNNNGGSGSYTLFRDTAAPSGTAKINGGAASTNNTTLHLTLSATNPTAGDPVSDMAFSVNGGPFGAFQPFATTANVTVPAGEGVQTVAVEYRNGAGAVSAPASDTIYLVQTPPTVSSFTPTSGITGSSVTINGAHFAPGASVKFGSLASPSVSFVSGAQLNAVVPNGAVPGKIAVTTVAGTGTSATNFTPSLSITGFSPGGGPAGTVVTINGVGFNSTSTVKFNATPATTVTPVSATQLKATVPAGATTGPISVTNTTGVTGTVKSAAFYAAAPPTVTSFTPASGITGSSVTINGTNFVQSATVKFGALASPTVTFVSASMLRAVVPNGAVPGAIKVTTPAGAGTSATNFTPSLSITGFSPGGGPAGTVVTINGVGFNSTSTVKFNATAATAVTHVSATQLTATVPAGATTGQISVTNTTGVTGTVKSAVFYAVAAPTITSFTPTSGITGSTVTINGTNFVQSATVKFGALASSSMTFVSATQLKAVVPSGAVPATISVTTPAGTGTSATSYTPTLSITSFSPSTGPVGTVVTINGVGFNSTTSVKFHGTAATTVNHVSSTQLTATVPAGATSGAITVTNTTGVIGTVSSATGYTVT
jgi:hypothetical protein